MLYMVDYADVTFLKPAMKTPKQRLPEHQHYRTISPIEDARITHCIPYLQQSIFYARIVVAFFPTQ